jgi:hypothetical protein
MKKILFIILSLFVLTAQAQSGKIIGGAPPRYLNRIAVKPDTTIYVTTNTTGDLSAKADTLGGRSTVTIVVNKSTSVLANPTLPTITDTLIGTKFKVKYYAETTSETIGVFQLDLGYVTGFDGTQYIDAASPVVIMNDLEEYTFWPVQDVVGYHWAYTKTSGSDGADGNGIYSGSDSLSQENTYAAMAADGSQTFGLGQFPNFPERDYANYEYGLFISPEYYGEVTLANYNSYMSLYDDAFYATGKYAGNGRETSRINADGGSARAYIQASNYGGTNSHRIAVDSVSAYFANVTETIKIRFPHPATSAPSTTSNTVNILKWTGNGSTAVPSFGPRYETDTLWNNVTHIKMNNSQTLAIGRFNTSELNNDSPDYVNDAGILISPTEWGSVGMFIKGSSAEISQNGFLVGGLSSQNWVFRNSASNTGFNMSVAKNGLTTSKFFGNFGTRTQQNYRNYSRVFFNNTSSGSLSMLDTLSEKSLFIDFFRNRDTTYFSYMGEYRGNSDIIQTDGTSAKFFQEPNNSERKIYYIGKSQVNLPPIKFFQVDFQKANHQVSLYDKYSFPNATPSATAGDVNLMKWTAGVPSFGTLTGLMVDGQFTTGTPTLSAFGTGTYQRYTAVVELTSGASANTDIPLPTANSGSFGKSILLSPRDLNTTYDINVTGSIELGGASTSSVLLTKPTEFVCNIVGVGPTTYRWVVVDNAANDKGSSSASTDGSGDVVITHNKNHTNYVVDIQGTGTTLGVGYAVTAKTATTFTVRAYDTSTKAAITSTGVTFDWIIKE